MAKEVYEWIRTHRLYHLCIDDLEQLNIGDIIDVVVFDRNFEEGGTIWDKIPSNTPFEPKEFFRFNHSKIKYLGDRKWELMFNYGEFVHPIHYNTESLATSWTWVVPDDNNKIIIGNESIMGDAKIPKHRKRFEIKIDNLHPRTRIGWRGPIMFLKDVENSKVPVFWRSD